MKEKNLKQADLCRMTGIQTSLMSNYVNGKKSPTISNASLIADALDISLDQLAGRKTPFFYPSPSTAMFLRENAEDLDELTDKEREFIREVILAMKHHLH